MPCREVIGPDRVALPPSDGEAQADTASRYIETENEMPVAREESVASSQGSNR